MINSNVRDIANVLDTIAENDKLLLKPKIGETEFRKVHLPRFWYYGQIHPETKKPIDVNLSDWIFNVAGSYFSEVDVVSDTTGEVLFTVPPLGLQLGKSLGTINYEIAEEKIEISSGAILSKVAQDFQNGINLKQSVRNLNSIANMYSTSDNAQINGLREYYLKQWDSIFDRYVPNRTKITNKQVTSTDGSISDFDEDDFEPLY